MKKKMLAVLAATFLGLVATVQFLGQLSAQEEEIELSDYENMDLFSEVYNRVLSNYVEEVTPTELIRGAINGMLTTLDPHSAYLSMRELERSNEVTQGEFGGLGIEITQEHGFVKVVSPIDDTPAMEAGMQAGDYITEIDGESVLGLTLDEAVKLLRGPVGSDVTVTVERESAESELKITIVRDIIKISSADARVEGNSIVVRIKVFNLQTMPNVTEKIEEAAAEAGGFENIAGVVLDLRNNPGGLLRTAVDVSDAFLDKGEIVSIRERDSASTEIYMAKEGDLAQGKPIIVLINGGSASASEIVAGALQDHERAVILGTQSFGKGSVQTIVPLGGQKGGLRLTTARYYTPSGRSIQAQGITPDIEVKQREPIIVDAEDEEDSLVSEAALPNRLENDSLIGLPDEEQTDEEAMVAMEDLRNIDFQLAYAIDLLSGISIMNPGN